MLGVMTSYTDNATITASSTSNNTLRILQMVISNHNGFQPIHYLTIIYPELIRISFGGLSPNNTNNIVNPNNITDGNHASSSIVNMDGNKASVSFTLPISSYLHKLHLKAKATEIIDIYKIDASGWNLLLVRIQQQIIIL